MGGWNPVLGISMTSFMYKVITTGDNITKKFSIKNYLGKYPACIVMLVWKFEIDIQCILCNTSQ